MKAQTEEVPAETGEGVEKKVEAKPEEGTKEGELYPQGRKPVEEEEEEEVKGSTLEDYLKGKKSTHYKKEARKPEELKKTNIEKAQEK